MSLSCLCRHHAAITQRLGIHSGHFLRSLLTASPGKLSHRPCVSGCFCAGSCSGPSKATPEVLAGDRPAHQGPAGRGGPLVHRFSKKETRRWRFNSEGAAFAITPASKTVSSPEARVPPNTGVVWAERCAGAEARALTAVLPQFPSPPNPRREASGRAGPPAPGPGPQPQAALGPASWEGVRCGTKPRLGHIWDGFPPLPRAVLERQG